MLSPPGRIGQLRLVGAAPCLLLLAALLLAACARPVAPAPANRATLHLLTSFPTSLDPAQGGGGDATLFLQSVFSGLVRYDADGHLQPDLAAKWVISDDGKVYTFTLRPNATFHDGTRVTAASIVYSLNRTCDPQTGSAVAGDYLDVIQGVRERLAGQASTVSGVTALDSSTVRVSLVHPDTAFLARLTFPITFAVDQKTVETGGKDWWQHPNGSGPFRLSQWQPDSAATLERSAGYYGPAPHLERVVLHNPAALGDLSKAFQGGTLDLLPLPPQPQDIDAFLAPKSSVPAELRSAFHVYDFPALQYLILNTTEPPFDDLAARQAVNLAIDKWALIIVAEGGDGWPAGAILPPTFPGYRRDFVPYPPNTQAAQDALRHSRYAGVPQHVSLASAERLPNGQPGPMTAGIATLLQQTLGWTVDVRSLPGSQLDAELSHGHLPASMALADWQADYLDPQDFLDLLFHSGRGTNFAQYRDSTVDHLLDQADMTADPSQRVALYQQAQERIMRAAPIVPLFYQRAFVLLSDRVASLPLLPDGSFDLRDARMR